MSGRQFLEWQAYAELEPFGEERADLRLAAILRMIFAVNRDTKVVPNVPSVSEFYASFLADLQERPRVEDKQKPTGIAKTQTWQEQKALLLEFAVRQAAAMEAEQRREARIAAKARVAS